MSAKILDGTALAGLIKQHVARQVSDRVRRNLPAPGLAVILVGNNPASLSYVGHKQKACQEAGIFSHCHHLPETCSSSEIAAVIEQCNEDPTIHGILLQLPLPAHISAGELLEKINPAKDVDGFHPFNMGLLAERQPFLRPCTPYGVMKLLASTGEDFNRSACCGFRGVQYCGTTHGVGIIVSEVHGDGLSPFYPEFGRACSGC